MSAAWYLFDSQSNALSSVCVSLLSFVLERSSFEHIIGESDSASTAENNTAAAIVTASSANTRPMLSFRNATGANTDTSTTVVAITANATWRVPLYAASSGVSPASMRRCAFSSTTIASSTTRPIDSASASSVTRLIE